MKIKKGQLDNGLKWGVVEVAGSMAVTSLLLIESGPRFDPLGKSGLSHFLEHMVFRGSKKWPTRKQTAMELEKRGMRDAAFSYGETNKYWIRSGRKGVGLAIESLIDRVRDPLLREKDIEEERGVVLDELAGVQSNPEKWIWELWAEKIWPEKGMGRSYIGSEETIKGFSKQDLQEFKGRYYRPKKVSLVVAGDVGAEEVEVRIKQIGGKWVEQSGRREGVKREEQAQGQVSGKSMTNSKTTHFIMGAETVEFGNEDSEALDLLATVLGGGMGSRLYQKLVEAGISYQVGAFSEYVSDAGYLGVEGTVPVVEYERAIEMIKLEMKEIGKGDLGKEDVERARGYRIGEMELDVETGFDWADWYAEQLRLQFSKVESPKDEVKKLKAVKKEELIKVAGEYLNNESLRVVSI